MKPVALVLHCPNCGTQHVDEGEWATKPHRTHRCSVVACKHEWTPHNFPNVGVAESALADPTPSPAEKEEFKQRWAAFVTWVNTARPAWSAGATPYALDVYKHFFTLLNAPQITKQPLTVDHAVRILQMNGVSAQDAGFTLFCLFVMGAIWGNRGTLPKTQDEDVSLPTFGKGFGPNGPLDLQ